MNEKNEMPDFGDLNVVFLTKYGSQLYGTATPESDTDLKGVFMPTAEQVLMGNVPNTMSFSTKSSDKNEKNTKDDVDCELYSFGYFLKLACDGQTVALEMLYACAPDVDGPVHLFQPDNVLVYREVWNKLALLRNKFTTKNMKAFMGYAKGQAVRYSLKGDKLNTVKAMIKDLSGLNAKDKLVTYMSRFELKYAGDSNVVFKSDPKGVKMMEVCRRAMQETVTVQYALDMMNGAAAKYGTRAKQAADHDGADFKALSHCVRITLELHDLYTKGYLEFPFSVERRDMLLSMKRGEWTVEEIMETVDFWMGKVETASAEGTAPEKVDRSVFNDMVLNAHIWIVLAEFTPPGGF